MTTTEQRALKEFEKILQNRLTDFKRARQQPTPTMTAHFTSCLISDDGEMLGAQRILEILGLEEEAEALKDKYDALCKEV